VEYDVLVNGELTLQKIRTTVFSVYNLHPGQINNIRVVNQGAVFEVQVDTKKVSDIIEINYSSKKDYTEIIQNSINRIKTDGLIIINEGIYDVRPLFLKSDITILLKGTLLGSTNRSDYPVLDEYLDGLPLGTWEGNVMKMFASLITGIRVHNVQLVGPGTINGNALNADWWVNHKVIRGAARPRTIYLNYCRDVGIAGLKIMNSPSWTIHPYYSDNLKFIDLKVENPKISPNTDGCNPESCDHVEIIGCHFSVGDDCIAIKSGKIEMVEKFYRPSSKITIRHCLMENGHGAIVLGSENSSGVTDLDVDSCLFRNTDRGLRIKTRRGRGAKARIDGITFKNIRMDHVLNPFVINMFYNSDNDGKCEYAQSKAWREVDERTPYLGKFKFQNIICDNITISAGFFYGLPEAKIDRIEFENVTVNMIPSDEYGKPAMMNDIEPVNRLGCYFHNVNEVFLKNLKITGQKGEELIFESVNKIIGKEI
jgi:polygalacturonase